MSGSSREIASAQQLSVKEKFTYPLRVYIFLSVLILFFLYLAVAFFFQLSFHHSLGNYIVTANKHFLKKNYKQAIKLYLPILKEYPQFRQGKIKIIQAYFALSAQDSRYLERAESLLVNERYSKSEIASLRSFLPLKYVQYFDAAWQKGD